MVDNAAGVADRGPGGVVGHVLGEQQRVGCIPQPIHLILEQLGRSEVGERVHHSTVCLRAI